MNQLYEKKENWHEDFIAYLASQYRPKIYVELGLYQCELFNKIVPYTDYSIGVDVSADAGKWMTVSEKTTFVNSTTDLFAEAMKQNPISIDMLFIDADHCKESVLKDFWNFFPFVNDHGLILLHDTHPKNLQYTDKGYCGDAYLVIEELKNHNDEFELMTIPIHPGLTLIRKRKTQLAWDHYLGFSKDSCIDDLKILEEIKLTCYSRVDVRAGWVGFGLPKTNVEKFNGLSKWATEHWAMYYSFLEFINPKMGMSILDVGCGMGHSTFCLSELLNTKITGIDFDPAAISFANKFNSNALINYKNEDFFEFQTNEKFDYIFALEILEHIPAEKHYQFLEKCLSLLTTEGRLFLTTPNALDGEDGKYGHIGLLNRKRARVFIKKYSELFIHSSFIDNKKLLLGPRNFIVNKKAIEFEEQSENLSHFRIVLGRELLNQSPVKEENALPHYKIVVIVQVYNELRKGNLERFWKYIQPVCDGVVVYDDGSTDGSYEYMLDKAIFTLRAGENDFKNEVNHKKVLLEYALKLQPDFILWMDADEVLTSSAQIELQNLCKHAEANNIDGISFHEINLWRSHSWKRIDNSYDLGWFVRLWRVTPELAFNDTDPGLHQQQYPHSISTIEKTDRVAVIHYGFASDRSLAFKYLVYRSHEQTGWALERLLDEATLNLEKAEKKLFPASLFIDDDKPIRRNFNEALVSLDDYKQEVFKPRISIVCLIYKSTDWLEFVYQQVLKYTDLRDKEFYFVANDANEEVLAYLDKNYIPYQVWNNSAEQKVEWYINNVYRAWNYAAKIAKGDYLIFINSDMAFSENWVENLFNKLNGNNCIASRLVESGKLLSGDHAISKNFGRSVNDYDETAFQEFAKTISEDKLIDGGLFMPLLIRKDHFMKVEGYPEGNIIPGTDIFNPEISKQGQACVSGDVVLMKKLESIGISHTTSYDSVVYHFQCGEMDEKESSNTKPNIVRTIIGNDYLSGRMGEKTMWNFLLSNMPNAVGVDKDILHVTQNFETEAKKHIKENYPESAVVVQNATFIDLLDKDHFTILYLQDNLRAMERKSFQQEVNLKHANLLVTNSKITAASYPEYNFEIIPIGVDDNLFRPLNKENVKREFNITNANVGIFVGDLSEVKGWRKVKNIIDNHDEIFWIIVSKDNQQYEKRNCKTFNRIDQEKLAKLLNCADFYILGSPVETQCLAAIEACFCNLPLIMRNTGIFADFTDDERAKVGYFGEDFETGITEVLANEYSPREMMFKKKLTIDGMVEKWKTLISQARFFAEQKVLKPLIKKPPFFSVIVPTYNQDQYLGAALDTLLAQTFTNWEAVIVNDGSTDNTKEVINKYLSIDKRFKSFHKENGGVATALNVGIENSKGEWICWLSSDDLFEHDKLEVHFKAINEHPDIKFFHSHWYLLLQENQQKIAPGLWLQIPPKEFQVSRFFWANYIHGNAIAVHKSVFDEVGLFDESLRQGQDFDMWLRISTKFVSHFIDKRTCITRIHPGQTTNSFAEGGVLDSTKALYKFLNSNSFEALFPFSNFKNQSDVIKVLNEIIFISTRQDAFLYRCGFTTALSEKTMEWLSTRVNPNIRLKVYQFATGLVHEYLFKPFLPEIKEILKSFLSRGKIHYENHHLVNETSKFVKKLIKKGNQQLAAALEIYLKRITSQAFYNDASVKEYEPILLGHPQSNIYSALDPKDISGWHVEPAGMLNNSIRQNLQLKCDECDSVFNIQFEYEMTEHASEYKFICPACKKGFSYNDKNFDLDFMEFHQNAVSGQVKQHPSRQVAFLIPDVSTIGGGTKIVFKHINWLLKLGCEVTMYSYTRPPDWIDIKIQFIQINDVNQIDEKNADIFIIFSIFDIPRILNKVPISKIVHLCQGYEGYHYGNNYNQLRSDKHILTKLHAIPVKNISVSKHLVQLFKNKFSREVEYIPNGIDHNIFSFEHFNVNREKSILFIGNPFHPLKGFQFLSQVLKNIQNSPVRVDSLKLYIVMGFSVGNVEEIRKSLEGESGCQIEFMFKLSSEEIAVLIKKVSIVICTSWYEGFSLPLLEAMACGTPVITTNNMGAESFCVNTKNAFVIKFGDLGGFSQKIVDILYFRYDLKMILQNAYQTSLEFSEFNSAKSLINTYQNLMALPFENKKVESLLKKIAPICQLTENEKTNIFELHKENTISVIIPVFNNIEYTKSCIESLQKTTPQLAELIIIDNASNDDTGEYLSELKSKDNKIKIISNEVNLGFPKAINQGLQESTSNFVVIANNDIIFTEKWAWQLIEAADSDDRIGIVGPISNCVSGVQVDKNAKYKSIEAMHKYAAVNLKTNKGKIIEFPRVAFLCTLIKKEVIDKIGGLDERFSPGNFEDDDFCLRAQLAGYKTVIAQDVFIHHYGSKSFKADGVKAYAERLEKNKQIFIEKWGADPEEIWLEGKSINSRNPVFPIDVNPFTASVKRAKIYLDDKDYSSASIYLNEAIECFEKFSRKDFEQITLTDLLNLAANAALMTGDTQKAHELFEKELQANPSSSRACAGLGEVFLKEEKHNEAKTMLEWAIKNDPLNQLAKNSLEKVNEILGLPVNDNSLNEHKSVEEQVEELFAETYSLYEKKLFNESLAVLIELEKFIESNPEEINPETAASIINLSGYNYLSLGNNDKARQSFEKSLNILPTSSTACAGLGEIFYLQKMDEEAKTMYEWGVKNDPNNQLAINGLKKTNAALGLKFDHNSLNTPKSIDEQIEELFTETYSLYEKKSFTESLTILFELEKFVDSCTEEINPDTLISIINLSGYNYIGLGDIDKARESFEKALSINPSSSSACAGLGEIFALHEMNSEAKTMFEWAVKNNPENQSAVSSLSKVNMKLGFSENHNSLIINNINPKRKIEEKLELAEELVSENKNDEAEALLQEVLCSEPNNVIALNNLSVIEILNENYENGTKLIAKVLAINPEDEIALENMNYLKEKLTSVLQT